ncbi:MAG: glycosyltransferase family 39 protein [Candidatus Auribacterota bacterium]|nr:glycosyltransferase family 39 protein [Candidatus Auribacterota bacterium]
MRSHSLLLIGGLLLAALLIRLPGITYGLPFLYVPDEVGVVQSAGLLATGNFTPAVFNYPLLFHVFLIPAHAGYFLYCLLSGVVENPSDFQEFYFSHPTWFYLPARFISLVFGMLTIWAIYLLGRTIYDRRTGLLSAAISAFLPSLFGFSRIGKVETLFCFFVVMGMVYIYRVYRDNRWKDNLLAGIFGGLAIAAKYNGALIALPLLLAHIFRFIQNRRSGIRDNQAGKLAAAAALMAIVSLPFLPFIYLGFRPGLQLLMRLRSSLFTIGGGSVPMSYSQTLFPFCRNLAAASGVILPVLLVLSLLYYIFRGGRKEWLLLVPFLAAAVPLTFSGYPLVRYYLPWFLIALVPLSELALRITDKIHSSRWRSFAVIAFLLAVLLQPLAIIRTKIYLSSQTDTRSLAYDWVIDNIPPDTLIVLENNISPIKNRENEGVPACDRYRTIKIPNHYQAFYGGQNWVRKTEEETPTIDELREKGVSVVIINSTNYGKYEENPESFPRRLGFYRKLSEETQLMAEFPAHPKERMGPGIKIYRIEP